MGKLVLFFPAGHGYNTPGKRSPNGMREWEFNDAVVDQLIVIFSQYENVVTYRLDDPTGKRDVPLIERTNKANSLYAKHKAAGDKCFYVSIHANAFGSGGWNSANGIETFVYPSKPAEALTLASNIQNHLIRETGRLNRGVKTANFHELRETNMTAVLVEGGFMTNKEEATLLLSDDYRKKVALGVARGIIATHHVKLKKPSTPAPKVNAPQKPSATPSSGLKRVIVDGKQVGAFGNDGNVLDSVKAHLASAKEIIIERV
jgi:N-acetylmuramoyl-L-alanine amidase